MFATSNIEKICHQIHARETSVLEIRESTLAAMLRHSQLNCFIQERGIEQSFTKPDAACVDAPLFGIPVSFKDNICVEGQPVTVGTSAMAACIAPRDAEIVRQLKALGAVVSGKNNMHELSFGITSVNAQWGTVGNPAAPGYCAGGSSGGGAAAVAAGIVLLAVGTDTGGSVRIPASFCGITGFRPTSGRWSSSGIIPVSRTKDSPGLLTRSAADALFVYSHLTSDEPMTAPDKSPLRIGLPSSLWTGLDADVKSVCRAAIDSLKSVEHQCVEVDDTSILELSRTITFTVPLYEFFLDFPRTLVSLGWEEKISEVFEDIRDENVRGIIHAHLGGGLITPANYAEAISNVGRLRRKINALFDLGDIDLLAYPTVPQAVPLVSEAAHPDIFAECIRNTDLASNAALPSITIPVAPKGALPVGLSFDAACGKDRYLLEAATGLEKVISYK
ncbi:amidase family protein [Rhizobium tumorigenes]|uniref:amidase family protein n=1 Tax=Rhizobium tumorigenes TaxID=2041385 RepID=UPI00241DD6ED|nr:amidase family protein [Rhizobium tumorigenes]WFS03689.1 amidase family protein [Rhizobium tumorigenes]